MKKTDKKNAPKSFKDIEELGRKYGVQVTNMAKGSIRAVGFLGGVKRPTKVEPEMQRSNNPEGNKIST